MAIRKRKIKAKPVRKPKIKFSPFVRKCRKLYNRLQDSDEYESSSAAFELANEAGYKAEANGLNQLAALLSTHINCEVTTLQLNYPDHVSFRVSASYCTDFSRPPTTLRVVSISQTYWQAVMLAYIKLCEQRGSFI